MFFLLFLSLWQPICSAQKCSPIKETNDREGAALCGICSDGAHRVNPAQRSAGRRRGLRLHPLAAFVPACPEGRRAAGGPVRDTVCHCAPSMYLGVVGTLPWRKPGENVKRWIRIVAEPSSGARSIRIRCGMGLKHRSRRSHKPSACLRGCCSAAHPIVPRVSINDWGKRNSKYWSRQKNKNKNKSCRSIWFCINNGYP